MFIRCEGSASQSSGVLRLMWGFLIQGYAGIGPFFIGVFAYFWFMPTIVRLLSVECRKLIIAVVTHQWSGVLNNVCRSFTGFQGVQGSRSRLGGGFWTLRSAGVQSRSG